MEIEKNDLIELLRKASQEVSCWKSKYERYRKTAEIYEIIAKLSIIVFFLMSVALFRDVEITVDPNENLVVAIETKWWGIIKKERVIKWMKTDDYESPGWMTKDKNGDWYLYIADANPFID